MYIEEYLKRVQLNSIIFDDDILDEDIEYEETQKYIFSLEFLNRLLRRTTLSLMVEDLDCHAISNIRDVLNYVRFSDKVNKEYIPIINKILVNLNQLKSRGSSTFYKAQYLKRRGILNGRNLEKKDLNLYTDETGKEFLETLRAHMRLDYDLLNTLLYSSDEDFKKEIVEYIPEEFLSVINAASYECNELFKVEQFKKRVNYVLKHLNILEGKKCISDVYKAYKTYRKIKKVI